MTHRSKRDRWLAALLGGGAVLSTATAVRLLMRRRWILGLLDLAGAGISWWTLLATDYQVTATELIARSGPLRWRVPLERIDAVVPSQNPLTGPALSLDRLDVRYGDASVLVSPADKAAFLADLASAAPHLELRGDSVVRRA